MHALGWKNAAPKGTNLQRLWGGALEVQRPALPLPHQLVPAGLQWPSKESQLRAVKELLAGLPPSVTILYADGSKTRGSEPAGWALSAWRNGRETEALSGKLGRAEVFDAEVVALAVALRLAKAEREALALSDSQAAISAAAKGFSPSSQPAVRRAFDGLRQPGVKLEWYPAHAGVQGNERADQLAKLATASETEPRGLPTYAYAKAAAKRRHEKRVQEWWTASRPRRYGSSPSRGQGWSTNPTSVR